MPLLPGYLVPCILLLTNADRMSRIYHQAVFWKEVHRETWYYHAAALMIAVASIQRGRSVSTEKPLEGTSCERRLGRSSYPA
jgi:hypothetical protein